MRIFTMIMAVFIGAVSQVALASDPLEVIVFTGQSNMVGKGLIKNAPQGYHPMPEAIEFHVMNSKSDLKIFTDNFGPELSFAKALVAQNPGKKYIFIKWAIGGTSQAEWSPNWRLEDMPRQERAKRLGSLYKKSLAFIGQAVDGREVNISGMIWMQGESDSKEVATAEAYAENMATLIAAFRNDLNAPGLKVLMGLVNPKIEKYKYFNIVQAQMRLLATQDPLVDVVSAEGLSKLDDKVHYDEAGLIELGERFAQKWAEMSNQ